MVQLTTCDMFYRVTLVVEYLGWVDLDLGYKSTQPRFASRCVTLYSAL